MYHLYTYNDGAWQSFAEFQSKTDYIANIKAAFARKKTTGKTDAERNAATVMEYFILGGYAFDKRYGKLVMRALRHFDEVGISNDLHAALEELLDEGADGFTFAVADERVNGRPQYGLDLTI